MNLPNSHGMPNRAFGVGVTTTMAYQICHNFVSKKPVKIQDQTELI